MFWRCLRAQAPVALTLKPWRAIAAKEAFRLFLRAWGRGRRPRRQVRQPQPEPPPHGADGDGSERRQAVPCQGLHFRSRAIPAAGCSTMANTTPGLGDTTTASDALTRDA